MVLIDNRSAWLRLLLGLFAAFVLFHFIALQLGSDRGQWGIVVGAIVVTATITLEHFLLRPPYSLVTQAFRGPARRGMAAAGLVSALMLAVVPLAAWIIGWTVEWNRTSEWSLVGIFAQGGIAEEMLFRAYLFGYIRQGRSFLRACILSILPFAAVHLLTFNTMPWPVAFASVALSIALSFPLAYLFELSENSVWPPAVLHAVIQGTVKVITVVGDPGFGFPLIWMLASGVIPMLVFAFRRGERAVSSITHRTAGTL